MNDPDPWGYPPQVVVRSIHGHDMGFTVTVAGNDKADKDDPERALLVSVSQGKYGQHQLCRDNVQVVTVVITKLANELATFLDRNQSRLKRIFGKA